MAKSSMAYTNFSAGVIGEKQQGRFDIEQYGAGAAEIDNFIVEYYGGITRAPGTAFVREVKDSSKDTALIPFEFSTIQAYMIETGHEYMRFFKDGGVILSGSVPYELETDYLSTEVGSIGYVQDADLMYLAHENHPPAELTRADHDDWAITDIYFVGGPLMTRNTTTTKTLQANVATGDGRTITAAGHTPFTADHIGSIWRLNDGYFKITAFTSSTSVTADIMSGLGSTSAEHDWAEAAFSDHRGYPSVVFFHDERLGFAGHPAFPQSCWLSKPGIYNDFTIGANDDDGIFFTIKTTRVNAIRWADSGSFLALGTSGGVFKVTFDGVATTVELLESNGTSGYESVRIGSLMHYMDRDTRTLRELVYSYDSDSYVALDMTNLSKFVTESGVIDLAYQKSPNSLLWCLKDDGTLACLTRIVHDKIKAWHTHSTNGDYKAIAVIPDGEEDQLWMIVERTINGSTVKYIEYMEAFDFGESQSDAFFVHSGLSYSGTALTTVTGLDHLEGETVSILADGAPVPDDVVVSGAVVLDSAHFNLNIGLPYESTFKTLRLEQGAANGASHGKLARVYAVVVNFFKTLGGKYSTGEKDYEIIWRKGNDVGGVSTELRSERINIDVDGQIKEDVFVEIKQTQPLPMTILGVYPLMDTSDR